MPSRPVQYEVFIFFVNHTSAVKLTKGDEQEKSRDRNYKRTRRFQGRIAGNKVMF